MHLEIVWVLLPVLIGLILLGMPIGMCLLLIGFVGYVLATGWGIALSFVGTAFFKALQSFTMVCIPLFVLMGLAATESGFVGEAYETFKKLVGRLPGGLAVVTTLTSAVFGAVSGSSTAMAASMGVIAYPEMRDRGYNKEFAASSISIAGTIGILIPPSLPMILYAVILEKPIDLLFIAGLLPGLILTFLISAAIILQVKLNPKLAPMMTERYSLKEQLVSLKSLLPFFAIFAIVIGGLYGGVFTPTEAGALGAFVALIIGLAMRRLNMRKMVNMLAGMLPVCAMLFLVITGAIILSNFMVISGVAAAMGKLIGGLALSNWVILAGMVVVFLFLGMIMDIVGMFMIALPVLSPIATAQGFDPIWFGVICTILGEACLITPPVGLNVYVLAGVAKDARLEGIFVRVASYLPILVLMIVLLMLFPQIALYLPSQMLK